MPRTKFVFWAIGCVPYIVGWFVGAIWFFVRQGRNAADEMMRTIDWCTRTEQADDWFVPDDMKFHPRGSEQIKLKVVDPDDDDAA